MKSLLHRRLAIVLAAVVAALVLGGSLVYAEVRVAPGAHPPDNDDLSNADTVLPTDQLLRGNTTDAGTETGESAGSDQRTEWFSWQPASAGQVYLVSTGTTTPNVHVYTGDSYPLHQITLATAGGNASFDATAGTTYKIQVAASSTDVGAFQFSLWQPTPGGGPDNDAFADAASLDAQANSLGTSTGTLLDGTTAGATREDQEPTAGAGQSDGTVWYSWTVPNQGASLHVTADGGVTLAAYRQPPQPVSADPTDPPQGSQPAGLAQLVQVSAPAPGQATLTAAAGTPVLLQVSGTGQGFRLTGTVAGLEAADVTPPVISCDPPSTSWATAGTVHCTASDADSGLADAADASFVLSASVPDDTATDQAATETRSVCDKAGNCATAGPVDGLKVDGVAPDVTCEPAPVGWTSQPTVTVACTATDADAGLAHQGDASFDLTATGVAGTADDQVAFSTHPPVCDAVGNCTDVPTPDPAQIDLAAPTVTCDDAPQGWLDHDATIGCKASDDGSGLADTGDAELQLVTTVGDAAASDNASTEPEVVCDQAGNCTDVPPVTGLKIDRARPAVTCTQPPDWTRGATIDIACTATDEGSGLADADKAFTLQASIDPGTASITTVSSRDVCDLAGNCSDTSDLGGIGLDDQAPTLDCQSVPQSWTNAAITVSCSADDAQGSGVAAGDQVFDLTATTPDGTVDDDVVLGSRRVCDLAGNCATTPAFGSGRIDRVMPQATCTKPSGSFEAEVIVTCTASDVGSGLADPQHATFTLRTDVGADRHDAAAQTSTRQVCDVAGNCITVGPVGPFDVDRTKPAPGSDPTLDLPDAVHVLAARAESDDLSDQSVPVPFTVPATTSAVGAVVGCTPDVGGAFPLGDTIVTCSARDGADRSTDGTFTVDVTAAPDLAAPGPIWVGGALTYAGRGFGADSVTVELDGQTVGTATPKAGVVSGGFLIPAGTSLGSHVVVLRGQAVDDDPQLVVVPVILTDDPADAEMLPVAPPVTTPPTVPIGGGVGHGSPQLSVSVTPGRDRHAPYRFLVTAHVSGVDSCAGKLRSTVSAELHKTRRGKNRWRPVGHARTAALSSCTTTVGIGVSAKKLSRAATRHRVPVRVTVVFVDAATGQRVTTTETVTAR